MTGQQDTRAWEVWSWRGWEVPGAACAVPALGSLSGRPRPIPVPGRRGAAGQGAACLQGPPHQLQFLVVNERPVRQEGI